MNVDIENTKRIEFVMDLVLLRKPIEESKSNLENYEWDYKGSPFILDVSNLKNVLAKYLNHEINNIDLYNWSEAVEMREDIDYAEKNRERISSIISNLANSEINGEVTILMINQFLQELE